MNKVIYDLDFPHHESPFTQEQFEGFMTALSCWDISVGELLSYLDNNSIYQRCAIGIPEADLLHCPFG